MSSKKNGIKTTTTTTTTTRTTSKPPATIRKRINDTNVDRNQTKQEEKPVKTTKKPTNEDESKTQTRPLIKKPKQPQLNIRNNDGRKLVTKQKQPITPPSSRVTKTQFFPNKSMYTQAIKKQENKTKISTKTSTKPTEIGKNRDVSPDSNTISERPRTATLRKGSIVNHNVAGPEVPTVPKVPIQSKKESPTENVETEENYDDDFDSYESDFDEYHSSDSTTRNISELSSGTDTETTTEDERKSNQKFSIDDEKKLDSGTYELPEFKQKKLLLDNIKETIENENHTTINNNNNNNNNNNFGSLSDEGFEDTKSLQFINFLGAQQKYQKRKTNEMKRKRGEEILNMIKLDIYNFTLLDLTPITYDEFIKTFGKQNTVQISTQTGDDGLCEETQTDSVLYENKWTQYPPIYQQIDPKSENFWQLYKADYLGVGSDTVVETSKDIDHYNMNDLNKFIVNAGNLILNIQIENDKKFIKEAHKSNDLPSFSQGYMLYETQMIEILNNRTIINTYFADNRILTIHSRRIDDQRSMICVWRIGNIEIPEFLLCVFGETTCCAFNFETPNLIFAGLDDGTIVVWDLKEDTSFHAGVQNDSDFQLRTPTFTTEIHYGHNARIVSILSLSKAHLNNELFETKIPSEICSLDENGLLIIWGVINKNQHINIDNYYNLTYWGHIILIINTKIDLKQLYTDIDDFKCTDLLINHLDPIHLYISTNYGFIMHCLTNNAKPKVRKFLPKFQSKINCLAICPFSSKYFIAGFDNGNLNFYINQIEQPLMVLSDKDCIIGKCNVELIQWSHNRPLIFYTKDITNTIHVWNLNISDMLPINSIPIKERIVSMKLSPITSKNDNIEDTYMMIATESGLIYLYLLGGGHEQISIKQYEDDKRKFFNYIDRYV